MTNKEITCSECGNVFWYASTLHHIKCQQCSTLIPVPEEDRLNWEAEAQAELEAQEGADPIETGI
jgi:ribosomal protein S27E